MDKFRNIELVGTSHIAKDSVKLVKEKIIVEKPDIVCIELDPGRAYALKNKKNRPKNFELLASVGLVGFLFFLVGEYLQKKLGNIVKLEPGSDMITALNAAEKINCKIFLIDRDINYTIKRLSKNWKKREILKILFDILKSPFDKKEKVKFDLSKVPGDKLIEKVLEDTKERYPGLYKILVDERDRYMARNLSHIRRKHQDENILAVVGAGHRKGILKYLTMMEGNF